MLTGWVSNGRIPSAIDGPTRNNPGTRALDRLQDDVSRQQRFTANAPLLDLGELVAALATELTPLAIGVN